LLASVWPLALAKSAVLYHFRMETDPPAVASATTPATVSQFNNCFASEGCFGTAGNVDTPGGNLPDFFTFNFPISRITRQRILSADPFSLGIHLTIDAARDIGERCALSITLPFRGTVCLIFSPATEYLVTKIGDRFVANFFQDITTTCPAGERGAAGYPATLVCGPNFHTDVRRTETESLLVPFFAPSTIIPVTVDPTDAPMGSFAGVGRLKIFSVELEITGEGSPFFPIPEPSTLALLGIGLVILGLVWRRNPA